MITHFVRKALNIEIKIKLSSKDVSFFYKKRLISTDKTTINIDTDSISDVHHMAAHALKQIVFIPSHSDSPEVFSILKDICEGVKNKVIDRAENGWSTGFYTDMDDMISIGYTITDNHQKTTFIEDNG